MGPEGAKDSYGCARCWPSDASEAWEARAGLTRAAELIDQSHFHVMILVCPDCAQNFVSVFTEQVDWEDGEDPQYWKLFPLTRAEAKHLTRRRRSVTGASLKGFGSDRRCLQTDFPKGVDEPYSVWTTGLFIGMHD